jgi:hypothetical protein
MSQALTKKNLSPASLRRPKPARTVLLRMAADERRAKRIRALWEEDPEVTWKQIADYVGVAERSAHQWAATGGISYPNAKKLAQFFIARGKNISEEYVWRGDREATPNLIDMPASEPPHEDNVEALLREVLSRLDELEQPEGRLAQIEEQLRLLRAERAADAAEALKRNEEVLDAIRRSR